jgi:hypothetical protein
MAPRILRLALTLAVVILALVMTMPGADARRASRESSGNIVFGLTTTNQLVLFSANDPGRIGYGVPIRGLASGERMLGIDFRPANGKLYGVSSASQLYVISPVSGIAQRVGVPFIPALAGNEFGVDFNPTVDRLRIVSDTGQNLRVNPDTGAVAAVDGALNFAPADANAGRTPMAVAAAYTNNVAGATSTMLYDIDAGRDVLVTQTPPNAGTLNTVGSLGVKTSAPAGFDIAGTSSSGLAVLRPGNGNASLLYRIDLATGKAFALGRVGGGSAIQDIAILIIR